MKLRRWEIYLELFMEVVVILAGAALLVFALPRVLGFLWPFVAAWLIAWIAHPLIEYLEQKIRLPKRFGSAILIFVVISVLVGVVYLLFSRIGSEIIGFIRNLPEIRDLASSQMDVFLEKTKHIMNSLPQGVQQQVYNILGSLDQYIDKVVSVVGNYGVSNAGNLAKGMTNGLIGLVVMFFSSYLFLLDREKLEAAYQKHVPKAVKHKIDIFCHNTLGVLASYCLAQLKIMLIIVVILYVAFLIAGFKYRFITAILVSIVDIFPILGTGTVLVPWAIFEFVTGNIRAAVVLLIFYAICLITKQILQPKMMGDSMGISALATLFLIYVGLKLAGIGGMLLALIVGIFVFNLYKLGIFDRKITFFKTRIEMLTENSEEEEQMMREREMEDEK